MSGWQLDGFEELGELGVGGGGRVVLARHESTGRDVAVKYLAAWLVDSPERLADFRTEAELMAGLVDDNLVTLYEYVETDAGAAIAMELVEGVALRAILDDGGPLTPEAALTLMKGSLRGLGALHRQGVVHRDYKPENVMVDATGATKLVDYGIAAPVGELAGIAGTPLYMAPEQWAGEPSTAASDVYAASATFVESLTGHTVFPATTVDALRAQHLSVDPSLDDVPPQVRGIAEAGLAKDPAARITDAEALVQQLERVAGDAYGPDWEEHGRRQLAARAALLALLFPHARLSVTQHATALTVLGGAGFWAGLRRRTKGRGGAGRWGLAAAFALIVAAGAGAGATARAADATSVSAAAVAAPLAPTVLVAAAPAAVSTHAPTPKGKPTPNAPVVTSPAASSAVLPPVAPVAPAPTYSPPPVNVPPVVVAPVTVPPPPPVTSAPSVTSVSPPSRLKPVPVAPTSSPVCINPKTGGLC